MEYKLKDCIENPVEFDYKNSSVDMKAYGNKCSGCNSCGGGCYGCKVSNGSLEKKLE